MSHKFSTLYGDRSDAPGARFITGDSAVMADVESLADAVHGPNGMIADSLSAMGYHAPDTDCDCDGCAEARAARESVRTGVTAGEETGDSDGNAPRRTIAVRRTPATMAAGLKLRTVRGVHWHDVWVNAVSASRATLTRKAKPVHGRRWTPEDIDACASDIYGDLWSAELAAGHVTGATADRGTADARFLRPERVTVGRLMGDASNWARKFSTDTLNERRALAETATLAGETVNGPETRDRPDREMRPTLPTHPVVRRAVLMADAVETASGMLTALGAANDRPHRATAYAAARDAQGASLTSIAAELACDAATLRQWRARVSKRLPSAASAVVSVTVRSGETRRHPAQHPHAVALFMPDGGIARKATATRKDTASANDSGGYWRGAGAPMPEAAPCTFRVVPEAKTARRVVALSRMPQWAREMSATHRDHDGNVQPMPGARLHTARRMRAMADRRMARAVKRSAGERKTLRSAAGVTA